MMEFCLNDASPKLASLQKLLRRNYAQFQGRTGQWITFNHDGPWPTAEYLDDLRLLNANADQSKSNTRHDEDSQ